MGNTLLGLVNQEKDCWMSVSLEKDCFVGGSMVKDQLRELCNILLGVVKQEQDCLMCGSMVQDQLRDCSLRIVCFYGSRATVWDS